MKKIFNIFANGNPLPKTELNYSNNFQLILAIVMSAQTTDKAVNKITDNLFKFIMCPEDIINLGQVELENQIKSIGLYKTKAKNIFIFCNILIDKYKSSVPENYNDLIMLPGVGHKTAKVFMNCALGVPIIAVDTHVERMSYRLGLSHQKNREKLENELLEVIPKKYHLHAHHWLILHGRYICTAQKPKCDICSIKEYCNYYADNNLIY